LTAVVTGPRPVLAQVSEEGPAQVLIAPALHHAIPPVGVYVMGTMGAAAVAPMIATIVLHRELTLSELWHIELSVFLGPVGWLLADQMFPPGAHGPARPSPPGGQGGGNGNINFPRPGQLFFVPNEIVVELDAGTSPAYLARLMRRLHLTLLERQTFALTGRSLLRLRIDDGRSVVSVLRALARYARIFAAQPNYLYLLQQGAPAVTHAAADGVAQYVVGKLHLRQAHEISNGDDVAVAVIDSKIDTAQPELAGAIAAEYDAIGTQAPPHPHGTAIAGAIAAHAKLIGVAPKVKLLAARVFSGTGESAQGTTFNILKGIDWAAAQGARIVNMSFAGPSDPMIRNMLAKAYARGIVLIAAVGNGGPHAPPLYPAAYPDVIGVTATDADDKLLAQANRGRQVAVAAPGVDIVAPAPADSYQIVSGTSIAAAHVSGVAALLLAREPKLTPNMLKKILAGSAHALALPKLEAGAGEIDALAALRALKQ
jgi:Subtilase family